MSNNEIQGMILAICAAVFVAFSMLLAIIFSILRRKSHPASNIVGDVENGLSRFDSFESHPPSSSPEIKSRCEKDFPRNGVRLSPTLSPEFPLSFDEVLEDNKDDFATFFEQGAMKE
ncbi:hypothetical protein HDU67_009835 [Dinochytrium kinnereticum]|nr:hypothetical protein HDU67_009835 [Dinochytrium kinnereticum]